VDARIAAINFFQVDLNKP